LRGLMLVQAREWLMSALIGLPLRILEHGDPLWSLVVLEDGWRHCSERRIRTSSGAPDRPSPTITTKCHRISNGRFGHIRTRARCGALHGGMLTNLDPNDLGCASSRSHLWIGSAATPKHKRACSSSCSF
jgi:hypothetical protein